MSLFIYLFWLQVMVNLMGIFSEDNIIHGIILLRGHDQVYAVHYTLIPIGSKSPGKATLHFGKHYCSNVDSEDCVTDIMLSQFDGISSSQIFLRVFYLPDVHQRLSEDQVLEIITQDSKLSINHLMIKNTAFILNFTPKISDMLTFSNMNIDIEYEQVKSSLTIIFTTEQLFIAFIPSGPSSLLEELMFRAKYKSKVYDIMANSFACANAWEINFLIYKYLYDLRNNDDNEILHPCIPMNHFVNFSSIHISSDCVNFDITNPVTFDGDFNVDKCENLIKIALTREGNDIIPGRIGNFAKINLPLPTDLVTNIILYTDFIAETHLSEHPTESLNILQNMHCLPVETTKEIVPATLYCLQIVYLKYILKEVINLNDKSLDLEKGNPDWGDRKMVYNDPRIVDLGYEFESSSTSKTVAISIKTTTKSTTTDTSIATRSFTETTKSPTTATSIATRSFKEPLITPQVVERSKVATAGIALGISLFISLVACISIICYYKINVSTETHL